ncbi:MAG: hypothetical protein A2W85_16630 [Bacteroidetes bacterium GWF2_41_31]|nr:MAG: hypothetical protein A2W85_16630 [Bacteroidetes bacterium GWF2_41_31]
MELTPENWVENHGDFLFNFAYSRVRYRQVAEDLVQECFLSALKSRQHFRGESSERTWLTAILKRKVIDFYRKQTTKSDSSEDSFSSPFIKEGPFQGRWLRERSPKPWSPTADEHLNQEEFMGVLKVCLDHLPENWRAIFVLRFIEEMESDEICKELGCSASNLWIIIHRTRLKLRECVEKGWLK